MSLPDSRLAYTDCFAMFERALNDPAGIRIRADERGHAFHLRMRLHKARQIDRDDNARTYERGDPMFGKSIYDQFVIRVKEDQESFFWVYIERATMPTHIEALSDAE